MKKNTKSLLVAGGLAAGAAVVIGTILLWPKKASAASNPSLPVELDANLTAQQKADVGALLNSNNNPEALAQAAWNYAKAFNAHIASDLLAKKAISIILPQLDANLRKADASVYEDVLFPLYISTNPVELDGLAMKAAADGYPKLATLIRNRARSLSGL